MNIIIDFLVAWRHRHVTRGRVHCLLSHNKNSNQPKLTSLPQTTAGVEHILLERSHNWNPGLVLWSLCCYITQFRAWEGSVSFLIFSRWCTSYLRNRSESPQISDLKALYTCCCPKALIPIYSYKQYCSGLSIVLLYLLVNYLSKIWQIERTWNNICPPECSHCTWCFLSKYQLVFRDRMPPLSMQVGEMGEGSHPGS